MADYIKVSTAQLKNDAETIENLSKSIPTLVSDLEVAMTQLANCWEGAAWGEYQKTVAYYIEHLSAIYQHMIGFSSNIGEASKAYHRTEQDICSEIDKINIWF